MALGSTKRGDRYADCRIRTRFAFDCHFCYATGDREWSSGESLSRRPERLNAEQRRDLMEIVEDRYQNAATLITSQLPLAKWHDVIGEPTLADAILDRIVHNAHRLELDGPSMRKIKADKNGSATIDQAQGK